MAGNDRSNESGASEGARKRSKRSPVSAKVSASGAATDPFFPIVGGGIAAGTVVGSILPLTGTIGLRSTLTDKSEYFVGNIRLYSGPDTTLSGNYFPFFHEDSYLSHNNSDEQKNVFRDAIVQLHEQTMQANKVTSDLSDRLIDPIDLLNAALQQPDQQAEIGSAHNDEIDDESSEEFCIEVARLAISTYYAGALGSPADHLKFVLDATSSLVERDNVQ